MAQVTVELGQLMNRTNFKLFDFDYQFDDPQFKKELEQHVIDYYYDYEIGFETPDMFKRRFKARWNRMIGYYNKLYNTTLLEYNPLINYAMNEALEQLSSTTNTQESTSTNQSEGETHNQTNTSNQQTSDNNTQSNTQQDTNGINTTNTDTNTKNSDYPHQAIAGGEFLNGETTTEGTSSGTSEQSSTTSSSSRTESNTEGNTNTLSDVTTKDSGTSTGNMSSAGQTDSSYTKKIEGLTGTNYQDLITKERENILRISDMVINELKTCFILVY
jgi:hypothetical protein